MLKILFVFGFFSICQTQFAHAQSLSLEQITMAGSGCPAGSVGVSLSPDGRALSLLYSQFTVEGTGNSERNCQVSVRMRAPKHYKVHMAKADLRGFTSLPAQARGTFETLIRFTDWRNSSKTESLRQNFQGPVNDSFFLSAATPESRWGNCGGMEFTIVLETRFSMQNQTTEAALLSLDSSDITAGPAANIYHLELDACGPGGNGNGNGRGNGNGNGRGS